MQLRHQWPNKLSGFCLQGNFILADFSRAPAGSGRHFCPEDFPSWSITLQSWFYHPRSVFHLSPLCRWFANVCLLFFTISLLGTNDSFEPADIYAVFFSLVSILLSGWLCFLLPCLFGFQWCLIQTRVFTVLFGAWCVFMCRPYAQMPSHPPHPHHPINPGSYIFAPWHVQLLAAWRYFFSTRHWSLAKPERWRTMWCISLRKATLLHVKLIARWRGSNLWFNFSNAWQKLKRRKDAENKGAIPKIPRQQEVSG